MIGFMRGWRDLEEEETPRGIWDQDTDPTWYLIALAAIVLLLVWITG